MAWTDPVFGGVPGVIPIRPATPQERIQEMSQAANNSRFDQVFGSIRTLVGDIFTLRALERQQKFEQTQQAASIRFDPNTGSAIFAGGPSTQTMILIGAVALGAIFLLRR